MDSQSTKTTLYLNSHIRRALKKRVVDTGETMSQYADRAIADAIAEDLGDIESIEQRRKEPTESLEDFLKALKNDDLI
jgi:hypothetical protein